MKKYAALLTALVLLSTLTACGKKEEETAAPAVQKTVSTTAAQDEETQAETTAKQTTAKAKTTTSAKETETIQTRVVSTKIVGSSTSTGTSTTTATTTTAAKTTTAAAAGNSSGNSSGGGSSNSGGDAGDGSEVQEEPVQEEIMDSISAEDGVYEEEYIENPEADPEEVEEGVVPVNVNLNDFTADGDGVSFNGSTIVFQNEGTYILSGSMTGMVEVNSIYKVKLKLNGVNINNPGGPAILCTDAKKLTLTLVEGSYNALSDGVNTLYDGAICSNDTLEIKGAGALNIIANNEHGIASDDDIVIKNGDITINAVKSGLNANDDITISGGTLHVTGGTNGLKSKGTVNISGGSSWIFGGAKENKGAIVSGSTFTLSGGYVYALGCGVSEPDAGTSTQCGVLARFTPSLEANSTAVINCDGIDFLRETSPYAFNVAYVSTPDIHDGMAVMVYGNDAAYSGFTTGGITTYIDAAAQ